tara:strand:+ start:10051 stop:10509 length:459 start_codon:yes stop_codon:yes gene_type:complete
MTNTLHEVAADYIDADDDIKDLEEQIKEAKAHKERVAEVLLTTMIDEGAPSVEVFISGGKTKARIYPVNKLYARRSPDVDVEAFCRLVTDAGFGDLVKASINTNSLSAVVRELAEAAGVRDSGDEAIAAKLPASLAAAIKISTAPGLSIKRS